MGKGERGQVPRGEGVTQYEGCGHRLHLDKAVLEPSLRRLVSVPLLGPSSSFKPQTEDRWREGGTLPGLGGTICPQGCENTRRGNSWSLF